MQAHKPARKVARTPEEVDILVIAALNRGDVEAALALYEPCATFVPGPGQTASGTTAIREALKGFVALKPTLTIDVPHVIPFGDLALTVSRWTLKGTGPDGGPVNLAGQGAEVVRRQSDGTWLFVIDDPFASA